MNENYLNWKTGKRENNTGMTPEMVRNFLSGGGEMGTLTRNFDWSTTSVGTPELWPAGLVVTVSNLLRSKFPMFLWWGDEMIQFYNDAYRPSLGASGKHPSALGQKGKDCWPEIWDIISPLHQQVIETGEATWRQNQLVPIYRNGHIEDVYWTYSYSSVLDDDGNHGGILVTCMETTDLVSMQSDLQASEAKLRSILNSAPTAICVFVGPDLIVENPNQLMIEVMAAGPDIEGKSFRKLLSGLVDDDHKFLELVDGVRSTGKPYESQDVPVFFKAQNKTRYFNISFIPLIHDNGDVYAVLDVSVDVTQQVEARHKLKDKEVALEAALEQLRLSKEAAELGTFDMDMEKGTMEWDNRCRTLFGISHNKPVSFNDDFVKGLHPEDRERIISILDKLFRRTAFNGDYDVEYRTVGAENGVVRWVRAKGKVFFGSNNQPVRFIGSVLDITEQKMAMQQIEALVEDRTKELAYANESLQMINTELQRSNQNLEEFAHAASHDLKEPVRKIRFVTDVLKEQLNSHLKEDQVRSFNRIENASRRMANLIDDLLLYSHVTHRPHQTEPVNLNDTIHRVLDDLDLDIEDKNATISVGSLPTINGYSRQLQQLFQNLLSNAVKYSKDNVPSNINITSEQSKRNGRLYYGIKVEDNGIGFDKEYAPKIFQMFTRLHAKNEYSGTGVGLSIVKKVVENHHGFIEVESTPGEGSTFTVFLPAAD